MAQQPGAGESGSGPRRWRIEPVRKDGDAVENYKVVFMHNGNAYELGLFSTREEGTRVADVLTSECGPLGASRLAEKRCLQSASACTPGHLLAGLPAGETDGPLLFTVWVPGGAGRAGGSVEGRWQAS